MGWPGSTLGSCPGEDSWVWACSREPLRYQRYGPREGAALPTAASSFVSPQRAGPNQGGPSPNRSRRVWGSPRQPPRRPRSEPEREAALPLRAEPGLLHALQLPSLRPRGRSRGGDAKNNSQEAASLPTGWEPGCCDMLYGNARVKRPPWLLLQHQLSSWGLIHTAGPARLGGSPHPPPAWPSPPNPNPQILCWPSLSLSPRRQLHSPDRELRGETRSAYRAL